MQLLYKIILLQVFHTIYLIQQVLFHKEMKLRDIIANSFITTTASIQNGIIPIPASVTIIAICVAFATTIGAININLIKVKIFGTYLSMFFPPTSLSFYIKS